MFSSLINRGTGEGGAMFPSARGSAGGVGAPLPSPGVGARGRLGPSLVARLESAPQAPLEGHRGCVNTVTWSSDGETLVSGSDDRRIILWDWQRGKQLLEYASGHTNNVFHAKILPVTVNSGTRYLVTCAADGVVRMAMLREAGVADGTKELAHHEGRAMRLALQPDAPACFYSCGEDGVVRAFDIREPRPSQGKLLVVRSQAAGRSCGPFNNLPLELMAIDIDPARSCQVAVGGNDRFVRIYDLRMGGTRTLNHRGYAGPPGALGEWGHGLVRTLCPMHLRTRATNRSTTRGGMLHITGLQYSHDGRIVASYNDEDIYVFARDGGDVRTGDTPKRPVGAALKLNADTRHADRKVLATHAAARQSFMESDDEDAETTGPSASRPVAPAAAAGGGGGEGRGEGGEGESSSGEDEGGEGREEDDDAVIQRFGGHRNSRTVKGVAFCGGDHEYVMSGSDCGHIYIWEAGSGRLVWWRRGDADVVNVLEQHPRLPLHLATSGIDATIKLWMPCAPEPRPVPPEAEAVMRRNREQQGSVFPSFINDPAADLLDQLRHLIAPHLFGMGGSDGSFASFRAGLAAAIRRQEELDGVGTPTDASDDEDSAIAAETDEAVAASQGGEDEEEEEVIDIESEAGR